MDWSNERYVRLYTRDTTTWKMLDWRARTVLLHLLRKVDRSGVLDVGADGIDGVVAMLELPAEVAEPGIAQLVRRGVVMHNEAAGEYTLPKFIEAQEAVQSDAHRARESRARRRDRSLSGVTIRDALVTNRDDTITGRDATVTRGHAASHGVTPSFLPSLPSLLRERAEEHLPPEQSETATPPPLAISTRPENNLATPTPIHGATLEARQGARSRRWSELEQIRTRVAAKLGVKIRPLPPHDAGERELSSRILEAHTLERFEADCAHVFAVAEAQAIANREMRFLGGTLFKPGSWSTSLAMTMQEAQRPRRDIREQQPTYVCAHGDDEQEAS